MRSLLTVLLALLLAVDSLGQDIQGSPYSSYGFGDLSGCGQTGQALMGGTGVAITDPYGLVGGNPASYPSLLRPVFNVGVVSRFVRTTNSSSAQDAQNLKFLGLDLAVPFGKGRHGISLGLRPVSETGYQANEYSPFSDGQTVRYAYSGSGGINRAYLGYGLVVWQHLDSLKNGPKLVLGADLNYYFGDIEQIRKAYYPQGVGYYNTSVFNAVNVGSAFPPAPRVGAHFIGDLVKRKRKEDDPWKYIIGATYDHTSELNTKYTDLATSFVVVNGVELVRDTISPLSQTKGTIIVPAAYGFGLGVRNSTWAFTAEARWRDWTQVKVNVEGFDLPSTLGSSTSLAMGASYHPVGPRNEGSFAERMWWRAGARFSQGYYVVNDRPLDEMAFSLGASLPILGAASRSRVDLGVEFGQRGTEEDGLLLERFANVFIGLSFSPTEPWFIKRAFE